MAFCREIRRVFEDGLGIYGVRKVWRQILRDGTRVVCCTVARLMHQIGLKGVIQGKTVKTTISDKAAPCPLDRANRQFPAPAPNVLWLGDCTYVSTWQGFASVTFIIDTFAPRIIGWCISQNARAGFVLDTLEQALHKQGAAGKSWLVQHSDSGSQYVSIRYTQRLAEDGIDSSVCSVGDSYDNALAETINGLFKAEVIYRQSWRSIEAVELATLHWVDWFNHRRLLGPIGDIPPAEAEANC